MADNREAGELAEAIVHGTDPSPRTSQTPAGPNDAGKRDTRADAINQVFALFRLNYHNQFYAAYPDASQLNQIKRLWLETLGDFEPEVLLAAAKKVLESSEYLPTLKLMRECCESAADNWGMPPPREAFLEACTQPSPKAAQTWSHPAVYLAGCDTDWFFLANNGESITWPIFRKHYQKWRERALKGEALALPKSQPSDLGPAPIPDKEAQLRSLAKLRQETGL